MMITEQVVAWIWSTGNVSELRPLDRQALERDAAPVALELLRTQTATEAEWSGGKLASFSRGSCQAAGATPQRSWPKPHVSATICLLPTQTSQYDLNIVTRPASLTGLPPRSHGWHDKSHLGR